MIAAKQLGSTKRPCTDCGAKSGKPCRGAKGQVLKYTHLTRTLKGSYMPRRAL